MPAVSDVTDSPGSDQTLLISASSKHQGGESIPHSLRLLLPAAFQTNWGGMGVSSWLWKSILLPCPEATRRPSRALPSQ